MYQQLLALRCDNRVAASASGLPAAHYWPNTAMVAPA